MASRLNASYISILQRFCDVVAIYLGLYVVFKINSLPINNHTLLAFLSIVSIFQLIGGLTDFYRSWRGISFLSELISCFKNITLSVCVFYLISFFLPVTYSQLSWPCRPHRRCTPPAPQSQDQYRTCTPRDSLWKPK